MTSSPLSLRTVHRLVPSSKSALVTRVELHVAFQAVAFSHMLKITKNFGLLGIAFGPFLVLQKLLVPGEAINVGIRITSRAGIAGRGFAVVASEVKTLAQASGKATDDIAQKIGAVRETCTSAVATISQIIAAIKDLSIHATEISSGIRQQSNETAGIFASAESAASSSRSVAANMVELNGYADATYTASNEVRHTTALLFEHTRAVQSNVERFLQHVKRA